MLHVVDEYSRMRVGSTEARVFSGRKEVKLDREIKLGSLVLEEKMSYKYLGLELDRLDQSQR